MASSGVNSSSVEWFNSLPDHVQEAMVENMECKPVLDKLRQKPKVYKKLCEAAYDIFTKQGEQVANKFLISNISKCDTEWYWDLMRSFTNDPLNMAFQKYLDPDFSKHYEEHRKSKEAQSGQVKAAEQKLQYTQEAIAAVTLAVADNRSDYTFDSLLSGFRPQQANLLPMRAYQEELAEAGRSGINDIICAPTGSGKTLVAVHIVREHLEQSLKDRKLRRVAFLVPTIPLVGQQTQYFNRALCDKFIVDSVIGGEAASPKSERILKSHVTVMTPQILVNMVGNMVKSEQLNFWDFSLLIFDECHHATENHPYNILMQMYHDFKSGDQDIPPGKCLPQIIGMTASLGVGKGGYDVASVAGNHIITMAANMDSQHLSTVQHNMDELLEHVYVPLDELETVDSDHQRSPFAIHICKRMAWLEDRLKTNLTYFKDLGQLTEKDIEAPPPEQRFSPIYVSWYSTLLKSKLPTINTDLHDQMKTLEYIKIYQYSLELNAHLPTQFALEYLERQMRLFEERQTIEIDELVLDKFFNEDLPRLRVEATQDTKEKAIVEKLLSILEKQYEEKPNSRTIIFVRTRVLAHELKLFINSETGLNGQVRAGTLTSINVGADKAGMSYEDQRMEMEYFRAGKTKILVATTVAEEGLDIAECNLIIKYNYVSNEIAMKQRKGRGRAKGSRSVLVTQDGWVAEKEIENLKKCNLEKKTIEYLRAQGSYFFKDRVQIKIKELKDMRTAKRNMTTQKKTHLAKKGVFNLVCRTCNTFLCLSTDIRKVHDAHYVCVTPDIWDRVHAEAHHHPKMWPTLVLAGKISCKECRNKIGGELGNVLKYCNVFLPSIKAENLVVTNDNDIRETGKKWRSVEDKFFVVETIADEDKLRMYHKLHDIATAVVESLDKAVEIACKEEEIKQNKSQCIKNKEERDLEKEQLDFERLTNDEK